MAINFRGRVEGCEATDAGNYESLLSYSPPDYQTPSLIRKSVQTLKRAADPPTQKMGSLGHMSGAYYGLTTNWATFAEPLVLEGCEQHLHMPVFNMKQDAHRVSSGGIIFRPGTSKSLAMMFIGKKTVMEALVESGMVGKNIESAESCS